MLSGRKAWSRSMLSSHLIGRNTKRAEPAPRRATPARLGHPFLIEGTVWATRREQFTSKSANTCNSTINTSETCSTDVGGTFVDAISVGCNSVGGSCGVTYTHQQW